MLVKEQGRIRELGRTTPKIKRASKEAMKMHEQDQCVFPSLLAFDKQFSSDAEHIYQDKP